MDASFILIVVAVGAACFLLGLLVGRRRADDGRMITQRSPLAPAAPPQAAGSPYGGANAGLVSPARGANAGIDLETGRELERLLSAGKKIEAIRAVRERTGWGLKESKEAVERLEGLMKRLQS